MKDGFLRQTFVFGQGWIYILYFENFEIIDDGICGDNRRLKLSEGWELHPAAGGYKVRQVP